MRQRLGIRYVGGPTVLLQVGGLRLLTDPTFDPPGEHPVGSERLVGEVTGFVLDGEDLPTVYVSGDNASLEVVRAIADRLHLPEPGDRKELTA